MASPGTSLTMDPPDRQVPVPISSAAASSAGNPLSLGGALDKIEHYESSGQNIMQQVLPPGGGFNPSVGRVTGPSTAQGNFQITNSTWRDVAGKAGVDLGQYPTAMSAPYEVQRQVAAQLFRERGWSPWAPYNPALARSIGWQTGLHGARGAPVDLSTASDLTGALAGPGSNRLMPGLGPSSATTGEPAAGAAGGLSSGLAVLGLLSAGTHKFVPVHYDPFSVLPTASAAPGVNISVPSLVASGAPSTRAAPLTTTAPYVTKTGMRQAYQASNPGFQP